MKGMGEYIQLQVDDGDEFLLIARQTPWSSQATSMKSWAVR